MGVLWGEGNGITEEESDSMVFSMVYYLSTIHGLYSIAYIIYCLYSLIYYCFDIVG